MITRIVNRVITILMLMGFCPSTATLLHNKITLSSNVNRRLEREGRLETLISGENGSYGSMFNVRAKQDLLISSLDFYCDLDKNVAYEVYTKRGTYVGFENSPKDWTMILQGKIKSKGYLSPTKMEDFEEDILMEVDETRAFYVTLRTPDLRYTTDVGAEGDVYVEDENLEIFIGVGIGAYPFGNFRFRPRVYNGAVHYKFLGSFPPSVAPSITPSTKPSTQFPSSIPSALESNQPSTKPSVAPTNQPSTSGHVIKLSYLLEHKAAINNSSIPIHVKNVAFQELRRLFSDERKRIHPMTLEHGLKLLGVESSFVDMSSSKSQACLVTDDSHICSIIDVLVQVDHNPTISEEEVRHTILYYAVDISSNFDFFKTYYIGDVALETDIFISISGNDLDGFEDHTRILFEESMKNYVNDKLDDVSVSAVKISSQNLASMPAQTSPVPVKSKSVASAEVGAKPRTRNNVGRRLQKPTTVSSLDLIVGVTGEYLPPPSIDFGLTVSESLSEEGDGHDFLDALKNFTVFENFTGIQARPNLALSDAETDIIESMIEDEEETKSKISYPILFGILGAVLLMIVIVLGFLFVKNKKKMKNEEEDDEYDSISRIEDLMEECMSRGSRISTREKLCDSKKTPSLLWNSNSDI